MTEGGSDGADTTSAKKDTERERNRVMSGGFISGSSIDNEFQTHVMQIDFDVASKQQWQMSKWCRQWYRGFRITGFGVHSAWNKHEDQEEDPQRNYIDVYNVWSVCCATNCIRRIVDLVLLRVWSVRHSTVFGSLWLRKCYILLLYILFVLCCKSNNVWSLHTRFNVILSFLPFKTKKKGKSELKWVWSSRNLMLWYH